MPAALTVRETMNDIRDAEALAMSMFRCAVSNASFGSLKVLLSFQISLMGVGVMRRDTASPGFSGRTIQCARQTLEQQFSFIADAGKAILEQQFFFIESAGKAT